MSGNYQHRYAVRAERAGSIIGGFDEYGQATEHAREQSSLTHNGRETFEVFDRHTGETINRFRNSETIETSLHHIALGRLACVRTEESLLQVVRRYAADIGVPELGDIDLEEARTRLLEAKWKQEATVFARAAQQQRSGVLDTPVFDREPTYYGNPHTGDLIGG